ncbi:MAG TPA: alpha/beta hydrolase, partial [Chloroflexia bacterium]|nr:alpha/beta hydrolase [Chloroflexia bacterium]
HPKSIEVNGTLLHYVEQGAGEPVLFVHGGLGDFRSWSAQMEPFSRRYRAISYSRRGHYPNPWTGDYVAADMMQHVQDLAAFIVALELGPTHIVANSYGAYISLLLVLHHSSLVRTLSLAEPPVQPMLARLPGGDILLDNFMRDAWIPAGQAFAAGDLEGGVRLFIEGAVGKGAFDALSPRVREEMMKNALELSVASMTAKRIHMPDLTCEDAARIEAPTLLMRGEHSPRMYYLINDELARCLPNARQALIPNAAHVLNNHNPDEHNKVVLSFLAQHSIPNL